MNLLNKRYEILKELGSGGSATVFLARDTKNGKRVAVKKYNAQVTKRKGNEISNIAKRAQLEVDFLMSMKNRYIVEVYETFVEDETIYLVMEHIDGTELTNYINPKKQLKVEFTISIISQLLKALKDVHSKNVVHRDLKPQNILVMPDYSIKLLDFGILKTPEINGLTTTGNFIGTLAYSSPERLALSAPHESDLYSVGVIMYELLTGKRLFKKARNESQTDLVKRIRTQEIIKPSVYNKEVPSWLDSIVMKSLEKKPIDRFQSAIEFIEALSEKKVIKSPKRKTLFFKRKK